MATATTTDEKMFNVDFAQIVSNSDNYRKTIDKEKIFELSKSIKLIGLLHPLIVTDFDDFIPGQTEEEKDKKKYRLVSGFRRLAALKKAKIKSIPVHYRPGMTEQDIAEVRLTENIQREDVEPIEEAEAFREYLDTNVALNEEDLSLRVGKSRSFIRKRLELLKLIEQWDKVVRQQKIPVVVALEVARCTIDQQLEIYNAFVLNGMFTGHQKHVKRFIKENFDLKLEDSIFPKDVPDFGGDEMPACKGCQFNTKTQKALFDDYKNAVCRNAKCYNGRTRAAMRLKFDEYRATVEEIDTEVTLYCAGMQVPNVDMEYLDGYAHERIYLSNQADIVEEPDDDCTLAYVVGSFDKDIEEGAMVYIKKRGDSFKTESEKGKTKASSDFDHRGEQATDKDDFLNSGEGMTGSGNVEFEKPEPPTDEELSAKRCHDMIIEAEVTNKPPNIDWQLLTITNMAFLLKEDAFFHNRIVDFCEHYLGMVEEPPSAWQKANKRLWMGEITDPDYPAYLVNKWSDREKDFANTLEEMTSEEKVMFLCEAGAQMSKKYLNLIEKDFNVQIVLKHTKTEPFFENLISRL